MNLLKDLCLSMTLKRLKNPKIWLSILGFCVSCCMLASTVWIQTLSTQSTLDQMEALSPSTTSIQVMSSKVFLNLPSFEQYRQSNEGLFDTVTPILEKNLPVEINQIHGKTVNVIAVENEFLALHPILTANRTRIAKINPGQVLIGNGLLEQFNLESDHSKGALIIKNNGFQIQHVLEKTNPGHLPVSIDYSIVMNIDDFKKLIDVPLIEKIIAVNPVMPEMTQSLTPYYHSPHFLVNEPDSNKVIGFVFSELNKSSITTACIAFLITCLSTVMLLMTSIHQRKKEIGLRLIMGALKKDISTLLMTESMALSFLGCSLGLMISVIVTYVFATMNHWPWAWHMNPIFIVLAINGIMTFSISLIASRWAFRKNLVDMIRDS